MPKYIKTDSREIEIVEKTITILRCEIEACAPSSASEECFSIKRVLPDDNNELTVENTGHGDINVVYSICKNRTIPIPNKSKIGMTGSLDISFDGEIISLYPKVDSTVTITYSKGDFFNIIPGDRICRGLKSLIEYTDDGWDDWGW